MNTKNDIEWRLQYTIDYFKLLNESMHKLKERINYTAALLLVPITTSIIFIYTSIDFEELETHKQILIAIPMIASILMLSASALPLFISLTKKFDYPFPPTPDTLSAWLDIEMQNDPENAALSLKRNMLKSYENIITQTKTINDKRNNLIILSQRLAAYTLPILLTTAIITYICTYGVDEKPKQITLENKSTIELIKFANTISNQKEVKNVQESNADKSTATAICSCSTPTKSKPIPSTDTASRQRQSCTEARK